LKGGNKEHLVFVVEDQRLQLVVAFGGISDQFLEVCPALGPPLDVL